MINTFPKQQKGLSLIELLVALVLGLLITAAVLQIFLASKQTYSTNNALSRVQESGRFAIDFLTNDIRNAGYHGECISELNNLLNESGTGYNSDLFDFTKIVDGRTDSAPSWVASRVAGDVIHVKYASNLSGVTASGNTPANANTINLTAESGIAQGTIIIVSDLSGCDMFQNRSNASAHSLSRGSTGSPGNKNPGSNSFSHAYDSSMEILKLKSVSYYIGDNAAGNLRSLRRITFTSGAPVDEELIEGVQDMQILYGVADGNKQVSSYVTASSVANWDNVVSVRVSLLLVSPDINVVSENQTIDFNGSSVTIDDRRLAQVFSTTIGIRNRLP
nr:PilW family protein [uncultured Pseudomonas sp.]